MSNILVKKMKIPVTLPKLKVKPGRRRRSTARVETSSNMKVVIAPPRGCGCARHKSNELNEVSDKV